MQSTYFGQSCSDCQNLTPLIQKGTPLDTMPIILPRRNTDETTHIWRANRHVKYQTSNHSHNRSATEQLHPCPNANSYLHSNHVTPNQVSKSSISGIAISLDKAAAEEDSQTSSNLNKALLVVVEHVDGTTGEGWLSQTGRGVIESTGAGSSGGEVLVL